MVKTSFVKEHNPETRDEQLLSILEERLQMPFPRWVELVQRKVAKAIDKEPFPFLYIRCYQTNEPERGGSFKQARGKGEVPDIILGFCGNVFDFQVTLVHELLHIFRWDEDMVEAKALEIVKGG